MAVFNKNTLTQVSGFDNQIIAGELVWQQRTFWNLGLVNSDGSIIDTSNATIDAQIIRRTLSNVRDSRYGLAFDIGDYVPTPDPIFLPIINIDGPAGYCTLVIDSDAWDLMAGQPGLDIANVNGIGFSGRIKFSFPEDGRTPANDLLVFLLFLVRSDAIVNN
jgi:hypothetical protein